eukprot:3479985-Rhodomonas_salina.5
MAMWNCLRSSLVDDINRIRMPTRKKTMFVKMFFVTTLMNIGYTAATYNCANVPTHIVPTT